MQTPSAVHYGRRLRKRLTRLERQSLEARQERDSQQDLRKALLRLLQAAEGLDSLNDDESRAEAYADELDELSNAKEQAREALNIGVPPREAAWKG